MPLTDNPAAVTSASLPCRASPAVVAFALLLGACTALPPGGDPSQALHRLFEQSTESSERRYPMGAIYRGEQRRVARFGDVLTDAHVAAGAEAARSELGALAQIDRAALSPTDRLAYDVFKWQREIDLRWSDPAILAVWLRLPFDQFNGYHLDFPELSSGTGAARYRSVEDYEDGLGRVGGFVAWLGRATARFREGMDTGVVHPRVVVERMIGQFAALIAQGVEGSTFYGPIRSMPQDIAPAERERLAKAYAAAIRERILPAFARMRDFLQHEYLPRARASDGLSGVPGGTAYYRHLIEVHTTTRLTPEEIHALGLAEVARIRARMDEVRVRAGFAGTLAQFFEHVRTGARFKAASAEAMTEGFRAIGARVQAALPRLFSRLPTTALEIRPEPPYRERTAAAGRYEAGAADASRPGIFYFSTWDLPSRNTTGMESIYLHEAEPGHHLQISLARENAALPKFLRFRWITAYVEGWGLYAESLGRELGMYEDPYQQFGAYGLEIWRAVRLVVDTGVHAKGWTREQAIDYLMANSTTGRTDATVEIERYIAWPAQALAYKIGQLTITRLREKAQAALGAKFDVRAFHEQVLMTGALPLPVLEAKIDAWIAGQAGN